MPANPRAQRYTLTTAQEAARAQEVGRYQLERNMRRVKEKRDLEEELDRT